MLGRLISSLRTTFENSLNQTYIQNEPSLNKSLKKPPKNLRLTRDSNP